MTPDGVPCVQCLNPHFDGICTCGRAKDDGGPASPEEIARLRSIARSVIQWQHGEIDDDLMRDFAAEWVAEEDALKK